MKNQKSTERTISETCDCITLSLTQRRVLYTREPEALLWSMETCSRKTKNRSLLRYWCRMEFKRCIDSVPWRWSHVDQLGVRKTWQELLPTEQLALLCSWWRAMEKSSFLNHPWPTQNRWSYSVKLCRLVSCMMRQTSLGKWCLLEALVCSSITLLSVE